MKSKMMKLAIGLATVVCMLAIFERGYAEEQFSGSELLVSEYLVLPMVGRYGRVPLHVDPVQAKIAAGTWQVPQAGETLLDHSGQLQEWRSTVATDEGWLVDDALRGGYAYTQITVAQRQVVLLEATGHAMVFVNGEPRAGDPYLTERTVLPILLTPGKNEFLFHVAAGKLRVRLTKPEQSQVFNTADITVPSLVRGESKPVWVGIVLINARDLELVDTQIACDTEGGHRITTVAESVPPFGMRKIALPVTPPDWERVPAEADQIKVQVSLGDPRRREPLATIEFDLPIAETGDLQTRTYRSTIDDSVQAYCLLPALETATDPTHETGLLVTLHEAGETAGDHLAKLQPYPNVHVLAPGGRRAEGCDWEDWSTRDALEALDDAAKHLAFARDRVWLRGTDAGGHGVLRLAGISTDRWAALVPRDPWLEYPAEASSEADSPVEEMLERVTWSNRLTPLLRNIAICDVLLEQSNHSPNPTDLHELLAAFHPKFTAQSVEPGANSLDAAIQFCQKHVAPKVTAVEEVDTVTYNPGENARMHWLTILNQQQAGELSRAAVRFDSKRNMLIGLTVNVATLEMDVSHLQSDTIVEVVLDGEAVGEFAVADKPVTFLRSEAGWQIVPMLPAAFKQPKRYGGIRSLFTNKPVLVYGTRGTSAEKAWALAKARYDAETILVRLNGSVDVVADSLFQAGQFADRNVVLYGNADTNSAWPRLLSTSPVQVRADGVWIDRRPEQGDDVACVFVRPRRGSETAMVGVVGGTQLAGMRATDRLPYFVNGTEFPDLLLFSSKCLTEGNAEVRAAGYFGRVWTVEPGEIAWRDAAL